MRAEIVDQGIVLDARGKFGRGGGFGRVSLGYNFFGFYSKYSGIYSKKYYFGKPYISKMKFYRPSNPRTLAQENWRAVYAYALILWQNFSLDEKKPFNKSAKFKKMSGYNWFLSLFLRAPSSGFGNIRFGYNGFGSNYHLTA